MIMNYTINTQISNEQLDNPFIVYTNENLSVLSDMNVIKHPIFCGLSSYGAIVNSNFKKSVLICIASWQSKYGLICPRIEPYTSTQCNILLNTISTLGFNTKIHFKFDPIMAGTGACYLTVDLIDANGEIFDTSYPTNITDFKIYFIIID